MLHGVNRLVVLICTLSEIFKGKTDVAVLLNPNVP
jgi:hypothetical protein